MRLPIVRFPNIVLSNLAYFAPVFSTEEQVKHFCEYVTGLMAGDKNPVKVKSRKRGSFEGDFDDFKAERNGPTSVVF